MRKRVLACLLAILFCIGIFPGTCSSVEAKVKMNKQTLKLDGSKVKQIKIEAEDCNVRILKTSAKDPYCCYRKKISKVSMMQNEGKLSISVEGTSDDCFNLKKKQSEEDIIYKIYLPENLTADSIEINIDNAMADIEYVPDTDVQIHGGEDSMAGFVEPEGFKSKIKADFREGASCFFYFPEKHLKEVCLIDHESEVICPETLKHTSDKTDRRIVIRLEECDCKVSTQDNDYEGIIANRWY